MKQKIYILGLVSALIISLGAIFKMNHWPGAGYLLILGIFTLVIIFLPLALRNSYKFEGDRQNSILYWATWLTCFVVFTAMLFKILHWPKAGLFLMIALPFPYIVFLPVFIWVTGKNKNFNIYNTVFVLFLLAAVSSVSVLLALDVSKERIVDSLLLPANYNRLENAVNRIPVSNKQLLINQEIDKLIKTVADYQDLICKCDGITPDQWNNDPEALLTSNSWQLQINKILEEGILLQEKLRSGLSDFIGLLEKSPGYEDLAKEAPAIFDMEKSSGKLYAWKDDLIILLQPWSLTYLDGLETNLRLIKTSLAQ
jgi:hypothetical protein